MAKPMDRETLDQQDKCYHPAPAPQDVWDQLQKEKLPERRKKGRFINFAFKYKKTEFLEFLSHKIDQGQIAALTNEEHDQLENAAIRCFEKCRLAGQPANSLMWFFIDQNSPYRLKDPRVLFKQAGPSTPEIQMSLPVVLTNTVQSRQAHLPYRKSQSIGSLEILSLRNPFKRFCLGIKTLTRGFSLDSLRS